MELIYLEESPITDRERGNYRTRCRECDWKSRWHQTRLLAEFAWKYHLCRPNG